MHYHDHFALKHIAFLCNKCGLQLTNPIFVLVFIHKLSGYDAQPFVQQLGYDRNEMEQIASNEQECTSSRKRVSKKIKLRFVDWFRLVGFTLDQLVGNLTKHRLANIKRFFPKEKMDLGLRKGVYSYDYMGWWDKFKETENPRKETFNRQLKKCDVSDDEYQHAQNVRKVSDITKISV